MGRRLRGQCRLDRGPALEERASGETREDRGGDREKEDIEGARRRST